MKVPFRLLIGLIMKILAEFNPINLRAQESEDFATS